MASYIGTPYNDSLVGGTEDDFIEGGRRDDTLIGGGNDTITGGNGNDTIDGGGVSDSLVGGWGTDWLVYGGGNPVTVNLGTGEVSGGDAAVDTFVGFEGVIGGRGFDFVSYEGSTAPGRRRPPAKKPHSAHASRTAPGLSPARLRVLSPSP